MVVLCVILVATCCFDYGGGRIPNIFSVMLLLWGSVRRAAAGGMEELCVYCLTVIVVLLVLYPFFRIGGLGAGDVKLLSVCSGYFSGLQIFYFLFLSMLISVIFSVIPLLKEGYLKERVFYFLEYCTDVFRSGRWRLYLPQKGGKSPVGICMSGPILCSVLLCMGGVGRL